MKYGLQIRVPPSQQKKQPTRPPLPPTAAFRDATDEDEDVEMEIDALRLELTHRLAEFYLDLYRNYRLQKPPHRRQLTIAHRRLNFTHRSGARPLTATIHTRTHAFQELQIAETPTPETTHNRSPSAQLHPQVGCSPTHSGNPHSDARLSEISRQSAKNRALREIEQQHKKALEEDPSVFDYDGVYDEMKATTALPKAVDREERKSRYIEALKKKAVERNREREIIYDRKLAKERNKEDHLYADKEKFVTGAYKRKLAEQEKWLEEDRLRELREEKEDVTKKSDLSDFYFSLEKNVAFGKRAPVVRNTGKPAESMKQEKPQEEIRSPAHGEGPSSTMDSSQVESPKIPNAKKSEEEGPPASVPVENPESLDTRQSDVTLPEEKGVVEPSSSNFPKQDHHKRSQDALSAAMERFLARKKAKELL